MPAARLLLVTLLTVLLLPSAQAAPLTAESLAQLPAGDWTALAKSRLRNYDLPDQGLKMQVILFDTATLRALLVPLSRQQGFPQEAAKQAELLNALKPQDRSALIYLAVRDREAEPTYWSPVFSITRQSFVLRLAADENLTPFTSEVVAPLGFRPLLEKKPIEPNEPWRGLYLLEFADDDELALFNNTAGLLLEYRYEHKPLFLNMTALRGDLELDPDHPHGKGSRPEKLLQLFFDHFPPRSPDAGEAAAE